MYRFPVKCRLPYRVQVLRDRNGAYIPDSSDMPVSSRQNIVKTRAALKHQMRSFLMGTHRRVGRDSPVLKLAGNELVLILIRSFLVPGRRKKYKTKISISDCGLDHMEVLKNLTPEQLNQRYDLACAERWGQCSSDHHWERDGKEGVPLKFILNHCVPCQDCDADGPQFFSFCLNRPVNSDRVHHCKFCGKCYYFQPGCQRGCEHCGKGYYFPGGYDDGVDTVSDLAYSAGVSRKRAKALLNSRAGIFDDIPICYEPGSRGCLIPDNADYYAKGLAGEGYWGF